MIAGNKRLNIVISEDLHRLLKIAVAEQGETIGKFVADAIAEKIAKSKENK